MTKNIFLMLLSSLLCLSACKDSVEDYTYVDGWINLYENNDDDYPEIIGAIIITKETLDPNNKERLDTILKTYRFNENKYDVPAKYCSYKINNRKWVLEKYDVFLSKIYEEYNDSYSMEYSFSKSNIEFKCSKVTENSYVLNYGDARGDASILITDETMYINNFNNNNSYKLYTYNKAKKLCIEMYGENNVYIF